MYNVSGGDGAEAGGGFDDEVAVVGDVGGGAGEGLVGEVDAHDAVEGGAAAAVQLGDLGPVAVEIGQMREERVEDGVAVEGNVVDGGASLRRHHMVGGRGDVGQFGWQLCGPVDVDADARDDVGAV